MAMGFNRLVSVALAAALAAACLISSGCAVGMHGSFNTHSWASAAARESEGDKPGPDQEEAVAEAEAATAA